MSTSVLCDNQWLCKGFTIESFILTVRNTVKLNVLNRISAFLEENTQVTIHIHHDLSNIMSI